MVGKNKKRLKTTTKGKNKKMRRIACLPGVAASKNSPTGRFSFVLELGSASIWDYLPSGDANTLLEIFAADFTEVFADAMSLKAINKFVVENRTHLGRQCGCDWMRSLDFVPRSDDQCVDNSPFTLDETIPILQIPGGAKALLNALVLTKTLLIPLRRRDDGATFVPIVCPLITRDKKLCPRTEMDVKQGMNRICHGTGKRFFHEFQKKRGRAILDYLDYHWSGIDGSSCEYCDNLTRPQKNFTRYSLQTFGHLRTNCRQVYRPLKSGMMKDLELLRFVPRPRGLRWLHSTLRRGVYYGPYEGLAAGITEHGILCGFYLVDGFKAHY